MRKVLKILAIVAAVVVVLTVALFVLVHFLVTPERVRAFVIPKAEAAINRPITLQDIEVSLFSGISLMNLVVKERDGEENFIAAERMVLRYKLWPLLFRRIVVDEVRLNQPRIRIERLADGTFNFSDLAAGAEAGEAVPSSPEGEREGEQIDLLVSEIAVENGEILFIDHQAGGKEPYRLQATAVNAAARNISLQQPFPFRVGVRLNEGTVSAEGEINPETMQGTVQAEVVDLDLTLFTPYIREQIPGQLNTLRLGLRVTAEGGREALRSSGQVILEPIDLLLDREGKEPLPIRQASLRINYAAAVDPNAETIDIEKGTITYNGLPVEISGRVESYGENPGVNLQVVLPETEVAAAMAALPPELAADLAEFQPAGKVAARFRLAGAVAEPLKMLQEGEVRLTAVSAVAGGTPVALNGLLRLAGDALRSEGLTLTMAENRADIDLQADNLFGEIPRVRSAVRADRFALDPLLQASAAPAVAPGEAAAERQTGEPLDLPVAAEGSVRIGETVYKGLAVRDFDLQYRLEKNVLTVQRLNGQVAGGTFGSTATVDLGRQIPVYSSRLNLQGIQADPLVTAFWPQAAGTVFGATNAQLTMDGKGTDPDQAKRNLNAKGELRLLDGQLTGAGLVQELAAYLNLEELRVLRFSEAKGSFTVRNGKASVDSAIDGKDARLRPKGTINLDGNALDIDLNLRLSPALARRANLGSLGRLLSDEQGWTRVPLKVGGTFEKPRFTLATGELKERAGEEIQQRLQKELQKRLPGQKTPPGEEPPAEQPRQMLEDKIRGLFGN